MWVAHLSNGEIVEEPQVEFKDELSPWHLLIERCRRDNLRIVFVQVKRGNTWVNSIRNADGYACLYQMIAGLNSHSMSLFQGIASIVGDYAFICWVNDQGIVSQEIQQRDAIHVHSNLREKHDLL